MPADGFLFTRLRWRVVLPVYAVLLVVSHLVRDPDPHVHRVATDETFVTLAPVVNDSVIAGDPVRFVYRDTGPRDSAVIFLLHGSPGDNGAVRRIGAALSERYRVIAPDFPGFGGSTRDVPDYSFQAHGRYMLQLMDSLNIRQAHWVGFSMGGGVLLSAYDVEPDRVRSAVMLAAIGVQELELMGEYYLNHAVHGLQLAGLWLLREAVPHFGFLEGSFLSVEYARNFYDSDQRPLREILKRFDPPMLILHGDEDPLVHPAVAREHYRIVPQSEMNMFAGDHFMVFMRPSEVAPPVLAFVESVEAGQALTRRDADAARVAAAEPPMDMTAVPPAEGFTLAILMLLIIGATLVLEDLTCIGAGLMVARGTIGFWPATIACVIGLYIGDVLLYVAGRLLGRRALRMIPFRWMISEDAVNRSSRWFQRQGLAFVFVSRFSPGTRLPTYFAAGVLKTSFFKFSLFFIAAILIWTPALVWLSSVFGAQMRSVFSAWQGGAVLAVVLTLVAFLLLIKVVIPAATHRGRRLLYSRWKRLTRWEFWPTWAVYAPVFVYVLFLAVRFRSLSVFAAANPGLELGGFIGESKSAILRAVREADPEMTPPFIVVRGGDTGLPTVRAFVAECGGYPVVVKPDVGERGEGVSVVESEAELAAAVAGISGRVIVQDHVGGLEYGVFYFRRPSEETGTIFSITDKRFPRVSGDGTATVEQLILRDPRAVLSARMFLDMHHDALDVVPDRGTSFPLAVLGTHCRGSMFLDGRSLKTPELERRVDTLSRSIEGFFFGRFDIRVPTVQDFQAGRSLQVLELNGVTSEATHIYDPSLGVLDAWRTLFRQWRVAFEIGAEQRQRGVRPPGTWALLRAVRARLDRRASIDAVTFHTTPNEESS